MFLKFLSLAAPTSPFKTDLNSEVPHLMDLVNKTRLPLKPLYPTLVFIKGLNSITFASYKQHRFNHYAVVIEGQTVHFVHQKSDDPDAIPLICFTDGQVPCCTWFGRDLTGFSGSFFEFSPVIKPLTESWTSATGKNVSYHVVVPSLPGFVFSSPPPQNWNVDDNARIFNILMTEVLGYSTFAVQTG
ncbi:Alpha/Beta hydrolase protein [Mycena leptocephala]|nr:Alpha/Beta hydrolase protein [Mycena leptocephala]